MKKIAVIITILIIVIPFSTNIRSASADELSDNIADQLEEIDLGDLENYFNSLDVEVNYGAVELIEKMLKGEYSQDYQSIFEFLFSTVLNELKSFAPIAIGIIIIAVICGILDKLKTSFMSEEISNIIFFVSFISIILLLSTQIISYYNNAINAIQNIAKLIEIMSPIIITLMTAAGGKVSASVYSPSVVFLSGGVTNIVLKIVIPLIGLMTIFSVVSNITTTIKLNKFTDLTASTIKWILGIVFTVFTFFLSAQGITSATYDGISIKAAKYTISNSIPIVGGFLRDGFDLVVAGSVLIKNAVGVAVIFALFYTIFSVVINMLLFSWTLKFVAAIVEPISDIRISNICSSVQKCVTYLIAAILIVSLMLFITILLMICSANAYL